MKRNINREEVIRASLDAELHRTSIARLVNDRQCPEKLCDNKNPQYVVFCVLILELADRWFLTFL